MPENSSAVMNEKMLELRRRYFELMKTRLQNIDRCLNLIKTSSFNNPEDRAVLRAEAHKLAGTGTTYGFPDISRTARTLEDSLIASSEEGGAKDLQKLTEDLINACQIALQTQVLPAATAPGEKYNLGASNANANLPLLLILDDDENVISILCELFKSDARIITGENSTQAAELIRKHKPDLILLDNMMPGSIPGLSLLEKLKSSPEYNEIPVIMISASDKPDEVMRGLMAGAVDYITKPFDAASVAAKVRKRLIRLHCQILIADDDESVRNLLSTKFRSVGCKVVCATDGMQAWKLLQGRKYALALLDVMMPGYDGMKLLRMMKENSALADIPVVFLTARHLNTDVISGLNAGAADYIVKPFNPEEVVTRCTRFLKVSNQNQGGS